MTEQTALATQGTDLTPITNDEWSTIKEMASTLEVAGRGTSILPKGIQNRAQIAAIMLKGRELGLAPMYALEQIALVNGKPVVQGQALLAIIQRVHGRNAVQVLKTTDEACTVRFQAHGGEPLELTWTIEDAKTAGLLQKPGPWKQYPRTMLRWRCIAEGARIYFADTIAGVYLPDEMGLASTVDTSGNLIIDHEASGQPAPVARPVDTDTGEIIDALPIESEPMGEDTGARDELLDLITAISDAAHVPAANTLGRILQLANIPAIPVDQLDEQQLTAALATARETYARFTEGVKS